MKIGIVNKSKHPLPLYGTAEWTPVETLNETIVGGGDFGHTGNK